LFVDARTDANEMNRSALSDNRPRESEILQEWDAGPHVHAALDAGPGMVP
jgi:hypothetical protein